jgi:hypothetical protein
LVCDSGAAKFLKWSFCSSIKILDKVWNVQYARHWWIPIVPHWHESTEEFLAFRKVLDTLEREGSVVCVSNEQISRVVDHVVFWRIGILYRGIDHHQQKHGYEAPNDHGQPREDQRQCKALELASLVEVIASASPTGWWKAVVRCEQRYGLLRVCLVLLQFFQLYIFEFCLCVTFLGSS